MELAATRHPRYVLIGSVRWMRLSWMAGPAAALKVQEAGQLMVVADTDGTVPQGPMARVQRRLGRNRALQAGPGR